MSKNFLPVLIFITIYTKSSYSIPFENDPHLNQLYTTSVSGRLFSSLHETINKLSRSFSGEVTKPNYVSLASLNYNPITRRFYILNPINEDIFSVPEGRSKKKKIKKEKQSSGYFNGFYDFLKDTMFDPYAVPNDRKPPKKKQIKQKVMNSPEENDDDLISSFLDDLDDLFQNPLRDLPVTEESSENPTTSNWFGWFYDDADSSSEYNELVEKNDVYKVSSTLKQTNNTETTTQYKITTNTRKPQQLTTVTIKPITTKHTTTKRKVTISSPTTISSKHPTTIPTKRPAMTTFEQTATVAYTTQPHKKEKKKTTLTKMRQTTQSPTTKMTHKKNEKDCPEKETTSWISQYSQYFSFGTTTASPKTTSTPPPTTTSTVLSVATTTQAPAGWFSFFTADDDSNDDDVDTTDAPTGWFNNLFGEEATTKATEIVTTTIIPTTSTIPTTVATSTSWFNTFLSSEEDDAYSQANTGNPEKKTRRKSYKGYQLLRIYPDTNSKVAKLKELKEDTQGSGVMWWSSPALNKGADLLVPKDLLSDTKDYLSGEDLRNEVIIYDLQNAIAFENPKLSKSQRLQLEESRGHPLTWRRYHRYADILRFMEYLSVKYPDFIELIPLGRSAEGLPIIAAKVSYPNNDIEPVTSKKKWRLKSKMKPAIWIDGGIHAREWISPAVVTWILHTLVEGEHGGGAEMDLLRMADWYLLPVANPDGYEYTHTRDRLWRKSRVKYGNDVYYNSWYPWNWGKTECIGVDLNRNWDYQWGGKGSSSDPCSDYYAGPKPFSEPETKAISDFLLQNKNQMRVYMTLQAYSQMMVLPTIRSNQPFPDNAELMEMGQLALNALKDVSGTEYEIGTMPDLLVPITGTAHDWAKGKAGIKYSYAIKMRDSRGPYGFLLPGSQITSTAKETWEAIKTVAENL